MTDWTDDDLDGPDVDYDRLDFDDRDTLDQREADELRTLLTGLPERPGTKR